MLTWGLTLTIHFVQELVERRNLDCFEKIKSEICIHMSGFSPVYARVKYFPIL